MSSKRSLPPGATCYLAVCVRGSWRAVRCKVVGLPPRDGYRNVGHKASGRYEIAAVSANSLYESSADCLEEALAKAAMAWMAG